MTTIQNTKDLFGPVLKGKRLNPVHLAIGRKCHWMQTKVFRLPARPKIPDWAGSPGGFSSCPRHQAELGFTSVVMTEWSIVILFWRVAFHAALGLFKDGSFINAFLTPILPFPGIFVGDLFFGLIMILLILIRASELEPCHGSCEWETYDENNIKDSGVLDLGNEKGYNDGDDDEETDNLI